MNIVELEIFEQTSDYCELRLSTGGGPPKTRGLDLAAIDHLIDVVEHDYSQHAIAQKVFGSPQLRELGAKLAAFLDGDERWLTPAVEDPHGTTLRITAAQRLRHLPWELLATGDCYLSVAGRAPLLPVRAIGTNTALTTPVTPGNRPLRVLFMASSPEGVEPVLSFEAEEAAILAATVRTGTELVVEESGTLEGLRFRSRDYGEGYFDVLHLSGHATINRDGQPSFLAEDELGGLTAATADRDRLSHGRALAPPNLRLRLSDRKLTRQRRVPIDEREPDPCRSPHRARLGAAGRGRIRDRVRRRTLPGAR